MPSLSIHPSGACLCIDDVPFPLVIDTAWSAFVDPTEEEWRIYLATRRRQGFTAILVSVLYIPHDRVKRAGARGPFLLDASGEPDLGRPDPSYFEIARRFVAIAHEEYGLRVMLTVLWNNFVPGTWGAALTPQAVMPVAARRGLVERVASTFADLEPIFVVGGDDHYTAPEAIAAYVEAADVLRAASPASLLTTHTAPRAAMPDELADRLDFFLLQSGHNVENQELGWSQPGQYLQRTPRKPIIDSEPPYELHGKVGGHGRWSQDDVRRSSWSSVLSGSTAGIGYGAHGVWMWATTRGAFTAETASLAPFTWVEALALPGALDISLMARLMRDHALYRMLPAQQLVHHDAAGAIRCAASPGREIVALYLPYAVAVDIQLDLRDYRVTAWDLAERAPLVPDMRSVDGRTRFGQLFSTGDQLVIAERAG